MRTICQPSSRRILETLRSLRRVLSILACHSVLFVCGLMFLPQSCPCQKQPSTNTTTLCCGHTKSGRPGRELPLHHAGTPDSSSSSSSRFSVVLLPLLAIRDMSCPRESPPKAVISLPESPGQDFICDKPVIGLRSHVTTAAPQSLHTQAEQHCQSSHKQLQWNQSQNDSYPEMSAAAQPLALK